jgi:hypothetical protein
VNSLLSLSNILYNYHTTENQQKAKLKNIKNDFDRNNMFIFVSRNDFKREFIFEI